MSIPSDRIKNKVFIVNNSDDVFARGNIEGAQYLDSETQTDDQECENCQI